MRTGQHPGAVFDSLNQRGLITLHATDVERQAALTEIAATEHVGDRPAAGSEASGGRIIADTREQVAALNAAIRDHHLATAQRPTASTTDTVTTTAGEVIGPGDQVATRRNDRDLGVANRDHWSITAVDDDGTLHVHGRRGARTLPADYARHHVELAYATTVHGVQGETVDNAHLLIGETTGAAAAYVGMTRGRHANTAHLVAENLQDARAQWVEVFARDRADLGPAHAAQAATEDIDRYGALGRAHRESIPGQRAGRPPPQPPVMWPSRGQGRSPGIPR